MSGTSVNNSTTLNLDPLALQNNGGPTQTIALESGSHAIDFILIASCVDAFDDPVTTDQRLSTRPDDGESVCDVGAYESGAVAPIVLAPKSERVQIARSSTANSDMVNMAFTFTINGARTATPMTMRSTRVSTSRCSAAPAPIFLPADWSYLSVRSWCVPSITKATERSSNRFRRRRSRPGCLRSQLRPGHAGNGR
ncbi:choice-of-anchor Q domain-containing protein [Candidatus Binatus sp.]|uniref:choice-of-anchor Q domain-containing protein n=1 Tax=Candidatus Binatus sp. TaxID=2811406 RepID=UPI003BB08D24